MKDIDNKKIENTDFEEFLVSNQNKILDLEDLLAKHDNNIKSLENFVEKYVPCII